MLFASFFKFCRSSLFFLLILPGSFLFGDEPDLVINGGFEEVGADGYPAGWTRHKGDIWSGSSVHAYEGKRSILYHNEEKGNYQFITQEVQAEPGCEYEYSCMAKIVHKGDRPQSRPMIFMEFSVGDRYLSGEYNCMMQPLNTDWVLISGRAKVPRQEGLKVFIGLAAKPAGTADAKIWFDKVELKKADFSPLSGVLTTGCYRDQAFQGKVSVFCGLEDVQDVSAVKGIALEVRRDGKTLFTKAPDQILPDRLVYSFDSGELSPGRYELYCGYTNPETGKTNAATHIFTKLDKKPEYKCYVDEHNRLIVDGKPFFPLGMFFYNLTEDAINIFKTTEMNSLMVYRPPGCFNDYETRKHLLDLLQKNDLKLFYSIKDTVSARALDDGTATRKLQEKGLSILNKVKEHPAIIAWYIADELEKSFIKDAVQYRRAIEEADPSRPTWIVLANPDTFRFFTPASEIHGSDPYPIPEFTPKMALEWTRKHNKAVMGSKMLIQVPQAFCWGYHWLNRFRYSKEMCAQCRRPTKEEIEAMSWMCIAGGANGLIYFSFQCMQGRDKASGDLPRIPFDVTFGELREITGRIMNFEKVLLSTGNPIPFKIAEDGNGDVAVRAYELDGTTWLLAVNSDEKKSNELKLEMSREVSLQGTDISEANVQVSGKTVSVSLDPLQIVFIRLLEIGGKPAEK